MRAAGLLLLLGVAAVADSVGEASRAVREAHARGDAAAMAKLAARRGPDPWLVAERLCQEGHAEAAEAFAKGVRSKWAERLPAYTAARRDITVPAEAIEARRKADDLLAQGKPQEALALLARFDRPLRDVNAIRLAYRRGRALEDLRRFPEAAEVFAAAAEAADRIGWLQEAVLAFEKAAGYVQLQSDLPRALAYAERRLEIEHLQPRLAEHAAAHLHLGVLRVGTGDYLEAIRDLERSLDLYRRAKDQEGELNSITFLAQAHLHLGDGPKSLATAQEGLARARGVGGVTLALALAATGAAYTMMGEYGQAERIQREGLALDLASLGWGGELVKSRFFAELGMVHLRRGDYAKALGLLEREFRIKESVGVVPGLAANLNNRALIYTLIGDFGRAADLYEKARALSEKEGNAVMVASVLANLGFIKLRQEDGEAALQAFEQARATLEEHDVPGQMPTMLSNIGYAHGLAGRHEEALRAYDEALRLAREAGDRLTVARVTGNRGAVFLSLGRHAEAIAARREGLRESEGIGSARFMYTNRAGLARALLAAGQPEQAVTEARRAVETAHRLVAHFGEEQGADARAQFAEAYDIGARAALATGDAAALSYFLESGRAGTLLEALGGRARLRDSALPPELRRAEAEAIAARNVAQFALQRAKTRAEARGLQKELTAAEDALGDVVERIQREARRAADLLYPEPAPLAEIQAALGAADALVLYALTEEEALALVVTRDAARGVALGPSAAVAAAVDDPGRLAPLVVKPLALGDGIRRVLVSPDGVLSTVPFVLVLPEREVAYVPSGTTYRMLAEEGARTGREVLALGDPAYPAASGLAALPGSRAEAEAVGDVTLLGAGASKAGLFGALGSKERWSAVHVGCHGLVDVERPTMSALVLSPTEGDDGYLRVLDVYRARIPSDLVVLSACETARGRIVKAEGVVGFTRAFLFAGSPRVIVSLWKVDDEATRALMVKFYELWRERGTATALREAQRHVASQPRWRDPKYWAAWQLWGIAD